jgi:hypothetical protein
MFPENKLFEFLNANSQCCNFFFTGAVCGIRYKCSVCHDFDLCQACEAKHEYVGGHSPMHVLLKISVPMGVEVVLASNRPAAHCHNVSVSNPHDNVLHPNVTCDGCWGSIKGVRYHCGNCIDYDLCATCEAAGTHQETGHLLIKIRKPIVSYFPRHAPVLPPLPTNHGYKCPSTEQQRSQQRQCYANLAREMFVILQSAINTFAL